MGKRGGIPRLRRHKHSGQGMVRLSGVDHWCGVWPLEMEKPPASVRASADRYVAEWLSRGRTPALTKPRAQAATAAPPPVQGEAPAVPQEARQQPQAIPAGLTVAEGCAAFLRHAKDYFASSPSAGKEIANVAISLRPLIHLYGLIAAADFSPLKLKAVRQLMVNGYNHPGHEDKQPGLARSIVNSRIARIKRAFAWLASEEMVPPSVPHGLATVKGLAMGRTEAREMEPVQPADPEAVERALPHLQPHARGLVSFMASTGCRPGEACRLTLGQLDRTGKVWVYAPSRHKTKHRGKRRAVAIGPKGQAVLWEFVRIACPLCGTEGRPSLIGSRDYALCGPCADRMDEAGICGPWQRTEAHGEDEPLFSPARQLEEIDARKRKHRQTRVQPSQADRRKAGATRRPKAAFSPDSASKAVQRACEAANLPDEMRWFPNQLRHSHATAVRQRFGLEGAQVALGHATAKITEVYAERDLGLAVRIAEEIG